MTRFIGIAPFTPEVQSGRLGAQQDLDYLGQSHPRPLLQLSGGQASQGVGKNGEVIVGNPQDA